MEETTAVELERLRGTVAEGFASLSGKLDVLSTRITQTEADLDHGDERMDKLEGRLRSMERRVWLAYGSSPVLAVFSTLVMRYLGTRA